MSLRTFFLVALLVLLAAVLTENSRFLAAEDVLLGLPADFDVTCAQAHFKSVEGADDDKRQEFDWIGADHPLLFRFRGDRFTAELKGGKTEEPAPGARLRTDWSITIAGEFEKGEMRGRYRSYQTLTDLSDPAWKGGYLCAKTWVEGTLAGQADADGRVKITVSDLFTESGERPYETDRSPDSKTTRIKPLGGWEDVSERYERMPVYNLVLEIQLPVGQLQSEPRAVPPSDQK